MHLKAKEVLMEWLRTDYEKIIPEQNFCICGNVWFTPDLTCYDSNGIKDLYEVVYTSDLNQFKLWRMQYYFYLHNWKVNTYTVSALWIMKQTSKPAYIDFNKII